MLSDLLAPQRILLDLGTPDKGEALARMVAAFGFRDGTAEDLVAELQVRESQGATNVGHGVAIPHVRSAHAETVRVGYGRRLAGIDYGGDGPVRHVFMIVAPPIDVASGYLQVLASVARFAREAAAREELAAATSPEGVIELLRARGV